MSREGDRLSALRSRIKAERKRRGWDQAAAAKRAGLSTTALSDIETGKAAEPRRATLLKIAAAFGWDTSTLDLVLNGGEAPHPEPIGEFAMALAREVLPLAPPEVLEEYARKRAQWRRLNDELDELRTRWGAPSPPR